MRHFWTHQYLVIQGRAIRQTVCPLFGGRVPPINPAAYCLASPVQWLPSGPLDHEIILPRRHASWLAVLPSQASSQSLVSKALLAKGCAVSAEVLIVMLIHGCGLSRQVAKSKQTVVPVYAACACEYVSQPSGLAFEA